ncbi:hypothetical protein D9M71_531320 [compost metagenome]
MPRVPPAAMAPVARLSEYLYSRIEGMATLDMVAAVAMELPHTAEKAPQDTTVASARPPLKWPRKALAARYSCFDMPDSVIRLPISRNNGTTDRP